MKKVISTIVAIGFISTIFVNNSYAGDRHGIDPLWVPVAVLSTIAAVTIAQPERVVYERTIRYEPRRIIIREEPRHRHARYYESERVYRSRHCDYR